MNVDTIQTAIQTKAETKANELLKKAFESLKTTLGIWALPIDKLQNLKVSLESGRELSLEYVCKQLTLAARAQVEERCLKEETTSFLATMEQLKEFTQNYQ